MTKEKNNLVDNIDGNTMLEALRRQLGVTQSDVSASDHANQINQVRIATAYLSSPGLARIASMLAALPTVKLMLGSAPFKASEPWERRLGESEDQNRKLQKSLDTQVDNLRTERDHIPFTRDASSTVHSLVRALQEGNLQVRRYEKKFLHAKAYIFSNEGSYDQASNQAVFAGSSNLTSSGLLTNLELNICKHDRDTVEQACNWFDQLWNEAESFDLASLFEEIFLSRKPFEIFLRVLYELYGSEVDRDDKISGSLNLTRFQKHGVARALRLIEETGGAIVADEVGLGKTYIAGEIVAQYRQRRNSVLLLCPAALRDTTWKRFVDEQEIYLEVHSFEELARDKQLYDEKRRPHAQSPHLKRTIDEYQLVIIDEAHNYRHPKSTHRADALRALLYGRPKDLLLLTATPVNNTLWDLYYLLSYFIKQDSFLASKGIVSIEKRFKQAMQESPNSLSPDVLYPIIDATTVKRTRKFIQKHYKNESFKDADGVSRTIVFPEPQAISVRYELDDLMPGLFDLVERYFDPDSPECLLFARYMINKYHLDPDTTLDRNESATGLILSGLLKRFESSTGAFRKSIDRLVNQHELFIQALEKGKVLESGFFSETAATDDDEGFEQLLEESESALDAEEYEQERLKKDVQADLAKLKSIQERLEQITSEQDPKLKALVAQLEEIAKQANKERVSREDEINKRKVLIFSFFSDTVRWVLEYLQDAIENNENLACYKDRIDFVVGSGSGDSTDKAKAAARFAPKTAGTPQQADELDILISTDVLAEGVNLQQARHIINYDMPWNPMRLVQRHGRIDRIGSEHNRVFLRTIFPVDRLEELLGLEKRIANKIAMASASVGVVSPIANIKAADRDFTETSDEIHKLLEEDAALYVHGGTEASTQTGEEYRQTLREALGNNMREQLEGMPWKAGSGMRKGREQGIFFCAKVRDHTYLRFIHADSEWRVKTAIEEESQQEVKLVDSELGRCLRLIECDEDEQLVFDEEIRDKAYDLWEVARDSIYEQWQYASDPANLQPDVRPLNRKVADFIRNNVPKDIDQQDIGKALDIVESPWKRRDEKELRTWFESEDHAGAAKAAELIKQINAIGIEPFKAPEPLPDIDKDTDIELLVWMAISSADAD